MSDNRESTFFQNLPFPLQLCGYEVCGCKGKSGKSQRRKREESEADVNFSSLSMGSGKVEGLIRLSIVTKNKSCQAYLCVLSVNPSSALTCRFSIFSLLSFAFLIVLIMAYLVFNSTASFRPLRSTLPIEGAREFGKKLDSLSSDIH